MRTIVIKIGSGVILTQRCKLDEFRLNHLADQISSLQKSGLGVVLVVSGAVACGANLVDLSVGDEGLKRAAAGVGQICLISSLQQIFRKKGLRIAQILLTKNQSATTVQSVRKLLDIYLRLGIVAVLNENDVVDLNSFGGNDFLAAEVAQLLQAERLLILSTLSGSAYGVGGGETKQQVLEILRRKKIQAKIVDGKSQNIILRSLL